MMMQRDNAPTSHLYPPVWSPRGLGDEPAHSALMGAMDLGGSWVRWARAGRGGSRLQRFVEWSEIKQHSVGAAPQTQRLMALGESLLCTLDSKLAHIEHTKIGKPAFVLMGTAAKRAAPFFRPSSPVCGGGDSGGDYDVALPVFKADRLRPQRSIAPALALHVAAATNDGSEMCAPDSMSAMPQTPVAPRMPPLEVLPPRLRVAIATHSPREAEHKLAYLDMKRSNKPRTGQEEFARKSGDLFKALAVPFLDVQQMLFETIPELAPPEDASSTTTLEQHEDAEDSYSEDDIELLLAAGMPTGRSRMSRNASFASIMSQESNNDTSIGGRSSAASSLNLFSQHLYADDMASAREGITPSNTTAAHTVETPRSFCPSPPAASDADLYPSCHLANSALMCNTSQSSRDFPVQSVAHASNENLNAQRGTQMALAQAVETLKEHARHADGREHTISTFLDTIVTDAHAYPPIYTHTPTHVLSESRTSEERDQSIVTWINRMGGLKVHGPQTPTKPPSEPPAPRHTHHSPPYDPASFSSPTRRLPPTVPKLALGRMPAVMRHVEASDTGGNRERERKKERARGGGRHEGQEWGLPECEAAGVVSL